MFWVLKDPSGNVRQELHFFGWPGTKLPFVPRDEAEIKKDNRYMRGAIREPSLRYSAPFDEIMRRWQAGISAGQFLNETYEFDYPTAWETIKGAAGDADVPNSNAGAYSIGRIMLPELVRKEKNTRIPTPGWGVDLFEYYFPKAFQGSPNDTSPKEDARPDFFNETRNDERARYASLSDSAQSAGQRSPLSKTAQVGPAAARRAIEAAKADDAFSKRYVGNDRSAVDYVRALHRAAYPDTDTDTVVGAKVRPDANDSSVGGMSLQARDTTPARQALEAAKSDHGFVIRYLDGDRNAFAQMQSLIQAAYPESDASGSEGTANGAPSPMFQPWTPEAATEGLAPWMQSSVKDYLSRSPDEEADGSSKLAPWMRDQYPDWLRGS